MTTEHSVSEIPAPPAAGQIEHADLLVGLLTPLDPQALVALCADLRALAGKPRIVVLLRPDPAVDPAAGAPAGEPVAPDQTGSSLSVVPWSQLDSDISGTLLQSMAAAYQSIFAVGEKLGARACCVVASRLEPANPGWICRLVAPLLDGQGDLVAPCYTHRPLEGLLNSGVIAPLIRCLYGRRLQSPMGPDLGVSRRLFERMLGAEANGNAAGRRLHPLASLVPTAVCGNLPACQVHLGSRIYPPPDWNNTSLLIAQALGPVFLDMERCAPCWQRTRGSAPVPSADGAAPALEPQENGSMEIAAMINSFQLGVRDLQEIWRLVLAPATLFEIGKLARLAPEQFGLPDDLWVRIVYDFALGHRLRAINRDHLLRSLTPLYMGWVASFAREMEGTEAAAAGERLERLSLAFEGNKSYLVSRWRWPDRFNP